MAKLGVYNIVLQCEIFVGINNLEIMFWIQGPSCRLESRHSLWWTSSRFNANKI